MKNKNYFLICVCMVLCCACDTPQLLDSKANSVHIFKYVNEGYKNHLLTYNDTLRGDSSILPTCPKLDRNEPYFSYYYTANAAKSYDICELATAEKVIALHGNYYMYYPYINLGLRGDRLVVRDGLWSDICNTDPFKLPIVCDEANIYSETRIFEGRSLDKITHKKRTEMTIDDIVNAINRVIDEGTLDKYSSKYGYCN